MKKTLYFALGSLLLLVAPLKVAAQTFYGVQFDPEGKIKQATKLPDAGPEEIIVRYTQLILALLGLTATILIIISGMRWMTAGGNEEKIAGAKKMLKNAVIGLIIVLFSWMLVSFVFQRVYQLAA